MTEVTSYTREECIPKNISPTGVQYAVWRDVDVDLYEVFAVIKDEMDNEKPDRRRQPIDGSFTGRSRAQRELTRWLTVQWDASDAEKVKRMKPAERLAHNKIIEQTAEAA
jgi:hypothetical protein